MGKATDIEHNFTYHTPSPANVVDMQAIRAAALIFAEELRICMVPSEEATLALRKLQECVIWANMSIMLNQSTR